MGSNLRLTSVLAAALLAGGCAVDDQALAARSAISADQVPGIDRPHSVGWSWPEWTPGQFSDVQSRLFDVWDSTTQTGVLLTVVEGKDPRTGQWRVLYASKRVKDQWVLVRLNDNGSLRQQTSPATQAAVVEPEYMERADIQKVMLHGIAAAPHRTDAAAGLAAIA